MENRSNITVQDIVKDYFSTRRKYIVMYLVFSLATPIVNVYIPKLYGQLIEGLKNDLKTRELTKLLGKTIFFWLLAQILYTLMDKLDRHVLPDLQMYVRSRLIHIIIQDAKCELKEIEIGDIISKILKTPVIVKELFHQIRYMFLPAFMTLLFSLIYFYYVNVKLGCISTVSIGALSTFLYFQSKQSIDISMETDNQHNIMHEEISDVLMNITSVISSGKIDQEMDHVNQVQEKYNDYLGQTINKSSKFKLYFNLSYVVLIIVIIGYSIYLKSNKQIELKNFVSILFIVLYLINQISNVAGEIRDFVFNMGVIHKINCYLQQLDPCNDNSIVSNVPNKENNNTIIHSGHIFFDNISLQYPNQDNYIIHNYTQRIYPKDKVCIHGTIGTGKSSLIKCLLRFQKIQQGTIYIDGKDINTLNLNQLRKEIGYIPQDTRLLNRTVLENIIYGTNADEKTVSNLLSTLQLDQISKENLYKKCGKYGSNLSGGQKQIVLLLRNILKDTKIIILDEPTANLDVNSIGDVISILQNTNKTLIIISHDEQIKTICNRFIHSNDFVRNKIV